jgi:hypothetical protein
MLLPGAGKVREEMLLANDNQASSIQHQDLLLTLARR